VPPGQGKGSWLELEQTLELTESSWIAARAYSTSPGGRPDAEAHTNPVYVYLNGRAPYRAASLDAWVAKIDGQIAVHQKRAFAEKAKVLDYFQRSRDLLLKIRQDGGLSADADPAKMARELRSAPPGGRDLAADASIPNPTEQELKEFLKPVPPKTPAEALKTFEAVGGFRMELVASEPLVYNPVAAAFDEDGNLYVAELRDYPYKPQPGKPPLGRIRLLRDTDGDGVFDESHVFADNLQWPAGIVPWKGGIFVAACPDIWYLKDTDGDGKADIRRKVYTGFGAENPQAIVNNLQFWLDHKVYGTTAGNGGEVRPADDPGAPAVSVKGRDFRFDPVGGAFESITGTYQFGNTFDDWGNRFLCNESNPLTHVVLPQHYLARNPYLPVPSALHNLAPAPVPIFRISPVERWRQIRSSRRIAQSIRTPTSPGVSHHVVDAGAGATV
jgi:putative membrane-bound dehydrogenase-like protein